MGWPFQSGREPLSGISDHETLRLLARLAPVAPGARVLLAGFEMAIAASGISALGLHVTAAVELDSQVETLARNAPEIDSIIGPGPRQQFEHAPPDFDLVALSANEPGRANLLTRTVLVETAGLLASVRPGGMLLLYAGPARGSRPRIGHRPDCCLSLLNCFPGTCRRHQIPPSAWLPSAEKNPPFAVTLQLPASRYSALDWDQFAVSAAELFQSGCCESPAATGHGPETAASRIARPA